MTTPHDPDNAEPRDEGVPRESSALDLSALALSRDEATELLLRVERSIAARAHADRVLQHVVRGWFGLRRQTLQQLAAAALVLSVFEFLLIVRMTERDGRTDALTRVYEQAVVQGQSLSAEQMYRAQFWSKP